MTDNNPSRGFALPVILITCLALTITVLASMTAASSLRSAIDDQYYGRLADEAAQSGVTYAVSCLSNNAYTQSWTGTLTQTEDCSGAQMSPERVIGGQPNTRTTFEVGNVEGASDGAVMVTSTGRVDRLIDGTTTSAKTYTATVKRIANSAYIKFSGVKFGYYFYNVVNGVNPNGIYYFVKGSDGKLRAAGTNDYGQLGTGNTTNVTNPTEVTIPGKKIVATYTNFLSQGWNTYFKTADGKIYGAGWNGWGQLGNQKQADKTPTPEEFQLEAGETGRYVGLLGYATYVVTNSGKIYAAGNCSQGALGVGESCTGENDFLSKPAQIQGLPDPATDQPADNSKDDAIIADARTAYVRMASGKIFGWGSNYDGELGDGTRTDSHQAKQIGDFGNPGKPRAVSMGFDGITFYLVDSDGNLWATGNNYWGQLGINSTDGNKTTLQKVNIPGSAGKVKKVHADQWYFIALTDKGQVWGAGHNTAGQLGDGTRNNVRRNPVQFQLPIGVQALDIYEASLGDAFDGQYNNAFVVANNGKVYGAGGNKKGQLGIGNNADYVMTPEPMKVFNNTNKAANVTTGLGTTLIISNKQTYYTVGNNDYGQLASGKPGDTNEPAEAKFLKPASGSFVF